ncbi:hypothetical protein [Spiroplasma endosymbiont of Nephrotoma flavescens]|uniref:hypothetical protein n=1 Tax=Spiroplasma endosymbiont of Nephrotoma flavescens TaxID=3066302 RepID=UPI00313AB91F
MKIFTVLTISFNNIFTIPPNINNEKTAVQLVRNKRKTQYKTYDLKFSEINNSYLQSLYKKGSDPVYINIDSVKEQLPLEIKNYGENNRGFAVFTNEPVFKEIKEVYNYKKENSAPEEREFFDKDFQKTNIEYFYTAKKIKDVKITIQEYSYPGSNKFHIKKFLAKLETKPSTDIDLPETTTKFDGNHNYSDVIDNLDYLMIHRGDFDKFNYSYLYWTPVFNFIDTLEKGYYKKFTIKNHGFKDESYFYHKTSSNKNVVNENVLKIQAFNKTIIAGNKYLQLIHGEKEIWKYDTANANDYYLIKYLFGTLNYLNVRFSFLRYDPDLRNDIYLYFKNNIPSINNSDYKNVFDEIYEILGNFFASLFYATFDMDEKTYTEIDFKGVDNYNKNYFIQIGFFYRSLITFYPKKYLVNIIGNSELLLRSYFFTFDKKTHQENYDAFKNNNSIYQINFNVLKSYDNKLITLPTSKTANSINYLNTDIDIRYGINIFTLTFPLYHKDNISNYNFKIYDFNVLNSTAFIPDGSNNSEWDDLIPPANCKYSGRWIPTFNDIGCAIQNAGIKMINWMLTASRIITILRPLAIIAKATVNFSTAIFPVFKTVPAFYYTFQFLIGFAIFLMILRIFV